MTDVASRTRGYYSWEVGAFGERVPMRQAQKALLHGMACDEDDSGTTVRIP